MTRITVQSAFGPYDAFVGNKLLSRTSELISSVANVSTIHVLSSPRVWRHWGPPLSRNLRKSNIAPPILFDDRESSKMLSTVESIARRLIRAGADRRSLLLALGGGVVGDVAGFVAATYLRGVALVHLPTTLLAQIDSSVGGKTGVNLPEGKNLIGSFYPPRLVIADLETLRTLPDREYRSGLYELIKYSVIGPQPPFAQLESSLSALLKRDRAALARVIPQAITAKAAIVSADEHEAGPRAVLNFGHTFAHAFETATSYRRFLHGEAVAWGMTAATWLSFELGRISGPDALHIVGLIARAGTLPKMPRISADRLLALMRKDKKARSGNLTLILPSKIGLVEIVDNVPDSAVKSSFNNMLKRR